MKRYHSELGDLAPRDGVSRAIYMETESCGESHIYLDTMRIRNIDLSARFPTIHETCSQADIDMRKYPIPVVPAAHYFYEGVKANLHGQTSLQGLMWNYVGISRTTRRLERALADLNFLNHRIDRFYHEARPSRTLVEMRNVVMTATVIAHSASTNRQSRGCHYLSS